MKLKILILCLILIIVPSLPHTEINDRMIVQAAGVDFKDGKYIFTAVYPLSDGEFGSVTAEGENLFETFKKMEDNVEKIVIMSECQAFVLGNMGKDTDIWDVVKKLTSVYETYPKIAVCAAVGKASDLIGVTTGSGENKNMVRQFMDSLEKTSSSPKVTVREILGRISDETQDIFLPVFETYKDGEDEDRINFAGGAVFRDGKFAAEADIMQVLGLSLLYETADKFYLTYEDGEDVAQIVKIGYKIKVSENDAGNLKVKYVIDAKARYAGDDQSIAGVQSDDEKKEKLVQRIEKLFEDTVGLSKEMGIDFIELSPHVRNKSPKIFNRHSQDWREAVKQAEFEFDASVEFSTYSVRW